MRLLSFLLLCSHCLVGSANYCIIEDRNHFFLYRVTDAKIKNEEDNQSPNFIEYEIHEGSCDVKTNECTPTYALRAKCSAYVRFDKEMKIRSVESQNCSSPKAVNKPPVKAVQYPCLGCPQPIDKENKELLCFVHSSIDQVNRDADHPFYFDLKSIVNATRQVMFGWIYHIQFRIQQTNCSRSSFTSKEECKIDKEGESFKCTARVDVTPDRVVNFPFLECKSDIGVCIHCLVDIQSKGPKLRKLLVQVVDEYNINSNHTELYAVNMITRAIKKGFQRQFLYELHVTIRDTNCSKPEYSILRPECVFNETGNYDQLSCETKINVTDKTINFHSPLQCDLRLQAMAFSPGLGGLSPLRNRRNIKNEENDGNGMLKLFKPLKRTEQLSSKRHGHNYNKGHKHGKTREKRQGREN
ncbi:kininogen-2-like [Eleutherodactylus coqui]|uniref:kininogen-2-like n=1 Tax=Eleutherodactylus coqui TaxID=57060 RepID=UPI003462022C